MADKGWVGKYAFDNDALSADTLGRSAMADGFIVDAKINDMSGTKVTDGTITASKFASKALLAGIYNWGNSKYGDATNTFCVYG